MAFELRSEYRSINIRIAYSVLTCVLNANRETKQSHAISNHAFRANLEKQTDRMQLSVTKTTDAKEYTD